MFSKKLIQRKDFCLDIISKLLEKGYLDAFIECKDVSKTIFEVTKSKTDISTKTTLIYTVHAKTECRHFIYECNEILDFDIDKHLTSSYYFENEEEEVFLDEYQMFSENEVDEASLVSKLELIKDKIIEKDIFGCIVRMTKIETSEYLIKSKNIFTQYESYFKSYLELYSPSSRNYFESWSYDQLDLLERIENRVDEMALISNDLSKSIEIKKDFYLTYFSFDELDIEEPTEDFFINSEIRHIKHAYILCNLLSKNINDLYITCVYNYGYEIRNGKIRETISPVILNTNKNLTIINQFRLDKDYLGLSKGILMLVANVRLS